MDKEKYGIELDIILDKFNQKIQKVKKDVSSIQKIDINSPEQWRKAIDQIKQRNMINEQLTNEKKEYGVLNTVSKKTNSSISKGFDTMTSKIKRFGLALLSIRSIYALVSRASSAYLSQDTELANKLQSAWIGLGAILAPIINFIATLMLKLVSVVNMVVKALTGVDLIAKANAKSMKSAAGSANSLKKALAGFDELTNLDTDTGGGAGGFGNWADAFSDIDVKWNEMIDKIYKGLDSFKTNITKKMKESFENVKKVLKKSGFSDDFIYMFDVATTGSIRIVEGIIDAIKGIFQILDGILTLNKDKIIEGVMTLGNSIKNIVIGLIEVVIRSCIYGISGDKRFIS